MLFIESVNFISHLVLRRPTLYSGAYILDSSDKSHVFVDIGKFISYITNSGIPKPKPFFVLDEMPVAWSADLHILVRIQARKEIVKEKMLRFKLTDFR